MDATLTEARRILRSSPYGFLVTTPGEHPGPGTTPAVRLVEPLAVDDDLTVWVGVSPSSRKADHVRVHPDVALAVEDRPSLAYATVSGPASLEDDLDRRRTLWRPHLAPFFPGGPEGDLFALLRVAATRVELMSFTAGVHPAPYGLAAATLVRDGAAGAWAPARPTTEPAGT